jgi:hypothetical protein
MDDKEIETRLKGADDLARAMFNLMEQMNIMNGRQMTEHDKTGLKEMLLGLRNMLVETYKRRAGFLGSIK